MKSPKPPILKIRRTLAPATKVIKSKKVYSRKKKSIEKYCNIAIS